jgi:hypothetical protein
MSAILPEGYQKRDCAAVTSTIGKGSAFSSTDLRQS